MLPMQSRLLIFRVDPLGFDGGIFILLPIRLKDQMLC